MASVTIQTSPQGGAYTVHLHIARDLTLQVGSLGNIFLPAGNYAYIGSARSGIAQRVARHYRLAESKTGKKHWHIDYLLTHPEVELIRIETHADGRECSIARQVASKPETSIPVPRFGSSDCRDGCAAHLFRIKKPSNVRRYSI